MTVDLHEDNGEVAQCWRVFSVEHEHGLVVRDGLFVLITFAVDESPMEVRTEIVVLRIEKERNTEVFQCLRRMARAQEATTMVVRCPIAWIVMQGGGEIGERKLVILEVEEAQATMQTSRDVIGFSFEQLSEITNGVVEVARVEVVHGVLVP